MQWIANRQIGIGMDLDCLLVSVVDCHYHFHLKGAGEHGSTTEWDDKIGTLSILMSSTFVYNSQGVPNKDDFEKLHFMGKFAQSIDGTEQQQYQQQCHQHDESKGPGKLKFWLLFVIVDVV